MDDLKLIFPTAAYADQIAAYRRAFLESGDSMDGTGILRDCEDPLDWIRKSEDLLHGENLPENWVPATHLICVRETDNCLVGMIQVRHRFNDFLEKYGGNIGYSVHPGERRKGYASWMLKNILPLCWELGLKRLLITCTSKNTASRKVILANGGVYESTVYLAEEDEHIERYWIAPEA